jgi:hypothetical protein
MYGQQNIKLHHDARSTKNEIIPRCTVIKTVNLYLTIHNIFKRQIPRPPEGFKRATPAGERRQNHAFDRTAAKIRN